MWSSPPRIALPFVFLWCMSNTRKVDSFTNIHVPSAQSHASTNPSSSLAMTATAELDATQTPSLIIDDILKGNTTAASTAVNMLMQVRGTDKMEIYLGDMMPPQKSSLPFWAKLPLTRFSRRARQLRLRQLLDISTPTADKDDDDDYNAAKENVEDDEESKNRRARRALFILLRNMSASSDYNGISNLLATVKKDAKDGNVSSEEMLKRTPSDLETPTYQVLSTKKGGLEIRRYEKYSVCSVTMKELKQPTAGNSSDKESAAKLSNPQLSGATSFGALAGYLFGKNEEEKAMKMTTPVFTEGDGDSKKMSFVLPSDYWKEESVSNAPKPLFDSAVKVSSVDGCDRAVLAFGGFGRKSDVALRTAKLREMLQTDKEWCAVEDDVPVTLAQYNDPFTPPWKRRNEVSIPVMPRK